MYAERHGGLNVAERAEDGFALLAAVMARLQGRRVGIADFKPRRSSARQDVASLFHLLRTKAAETNAWFGRRKNTGAKK